MQNTYGSISKMEENIVTVFSTRVDDMFLARDHN